VTGPGPYRTGHVLDPFGGSGTTAVAAAIEGRDATLIDLDPRNVDLVRRRLTDHCRILDEQRDGDTIVWTVEPVSRPELDAIAAGQMELFG
jgi:methylase of polypeptide subunit release factors